MKHRKHLVVVLTLWACASGFSSFAEQKPFVASPLAPRSAERDATMFHMMPAGETGVVTEDKFADPTMWAQRHREFLYGAIGTGVAIADYDQDGRPDIFVVSKTEHCRLFRNLGNWKFEDVTEKAHLGNAGQLAGIWKQGATFADVNNDGWLDLYVCQFDAPNLLYINQGDGTFKEEGAARGLAVKDGTVMAAFSDYDRDGQLDVFIVTNALDYTKSLGRPDRLFHNNGDGTFKDATAAAGISAEPDQGHAAVWWDCDNDGWPDLYVANDFSPPDFLYHNNGDGTFTDRLNSFLPHTTNSSMGADLGDFNNDGRMDFLVADMEPSTHQKDQRSLANSRAIPFAWPYDPFVAIQIPRNALFLSTGTGRFLEAAELAGLPATDWTWAVRCEDLDCDSRVDVFFTNGMVRELHNADLRDRVHRANSLDEQVRILKNSPVLVEGNLAYRNLGDLRFEDVSRTWGLNEAGVSFGAAFGDLDGDGDLDLVYTNYQANVTVLRNDADRGHRVVLHLRGTVSNRFGIGATVRIETSEGIQVRSLQLARGYMSSSEPMIHFGLGDATEIKQATITWPSGREQILTQLTADQSYVITEPASASAPAVVPAEVKRLQFTEIAQYAGLSYTARETPLDETTMQPLLPRYFNRCGPAVAVGDLNGDGTDDLCLGGTTRDPPRALIADRQGYFHDNGSLALLGNAVVNDGPLLIFDADGNGTNDLLLTSGGVAAPAGAAAYQPRLLLNQGAATFQLAGRALPALPLCVGAAVAADFDRDGKLDVFLGGRVQPGQYPLPARSALLLNRGGRFEEVTATIAPGLSAVGLVTSALATDVDGDGWVDLLLALEWGPLKYFHNDQGLAFADWTEKAGFAAAGTGLWTSLAGADFNGDGQPDYVAGNLGLNTPYHATVEKPMVIYHGQFEAGRAFALEGYYEGERLYPRATRIELGAILPTVLKRFPHTNDYARATLEEIVGAGPLAAASRFTVTQLQSGVFLSQPSGTFRFAPLPRIVQIAPLQSIVAGDFDGDGLADIFAVQNAYTSNQTAGRFDGGLGQFLRGDGQGQFTPVTPFDGGLVVAGDARALAVIDFDADGWPDFFTTRNKSPSLAWQNRGVAGHRTLELRLHGLAGNSSAIGARVTLRLANGSSQTTDITAGGGVLSQSTQLLYFGYPRTSPPSLLLIRWPSGSLSRHPLQNSPSHLEVTTPDL